MSCYYQIQLPGGGFIKIPSPINIINVNEDLLNSIESFYQSSNFSEFIKSFKEAEKQKNANEKSIAFSNLQVKYSNEFLQYSNLINLLEEQNLYGITKNILEKNVITSTKDTLIENINKVINKSVDTNNIVSAIKNWISTDMVIESSVEGGQNIKNINDLIEILSSSKVSPDYFEELPFMDIIGKSSINAEKKRLNNDIIELENTYQTEASLQRNIVNVLESINLDNSILYGMTRIGSEDDTLIIPKSKNNGFIYYNNENDLSLFIGLFKYLATTINWDQNKTNKLKAIIKSWNSKNQDKISLTGFSPINFFSGNFENHSFKSGEFYKIFKNNSINHLLDIVELISDSPDIVSVDKFIFNSKELFKKMDLSKYENPIFFTENTANNNYNIQSVNNKQVLINIVGRKYEEYNTLEKRDFHYSPLKTISKFGENCINNLYFSLLNDLEFGKDLVKITIDQQKGISEFIIITKLIPSDNGILIKGISNSGGSFSEVTHMIKSGIANKEKVISIQIRKFESEIEPLIETFPTKLQNAVIVSNNKDSENNPINATVVKKYIQVGSLINYISNGKIKSDTVKGVLPGKLILMKNKYAINYDKILSFNSNKFTEEELSTWSNNDFNKNITMTIKGSNSKALATSGDLIRYLDKNGVERINKVIESDKDNVYILIKDNSAIYIDKLPRLYIMDALVRIPEISLTNELDIASFELSNILNGKSIRRNNYSYSENLNELRNNDILVKLGDNNLTNKYFKVVDKDSGKVIEKVGLGISDYRVSILDFKDTNGFLTVRDISGDYSLDIDRVNSLKIYPSTNDSNSSIAYVIPKELNLESAQVLDSLHFTFGEIIPKDFLTNPNYSNYKDVTDQALKIISRKLNQPIKSVHLKNVTSTVYQKFNDELFRINNFDKLDLKDKIGALQIGAYIRLKNEEHLGTHLFRISNIIRDNVVIEYNVLSPYGEIKTVKLLKSKTELVNKIAAFHLIKGNFKIQSLLQKVNDKVKPIERTKEDIREFFLYSIQKVFNDNNINIKISLTSKEGNFKNGQKAKIQNGEILVNKEDGTEVDIVHEFLHVFLIGLKYSNSKQYQDLLVNFWKDKLNSNPDIIGFDNIEEKLVEQLSFLLAGTGTLNLSSLDSIEDAIKSSIIGLGLKIDNLKSFNLYGILNTKISDLVGIPESNEKFKDLLLFESTFRQWINNNIESGNLSIKCK